MLIKCVYSSCVGWKFQELDQVRIEVESYESLKYPSNRVTTRLPISVDINGIPWFNGITAPVELSDTCRTYNLW